MRKANQDKNQIELWRMCVFVQIRKFDVRIARIASKTKSSKIVQESHIEEIEIDARVYF